jgi:glucose dehydrogenase
MKSLSLAAALAFAAAFTAVAQRPSNRQVDDELLREGSRNGAEWISYAVNWSEQRFSPLSQINADNVKRLGLAWSYDIPAASGNQQTASSRRKPLRIFPSLVRMASPATSCSRGIRSHGKSAGGRRTPVPTVFRRHSGHCRQPCFFICQ